MKEIEYELKSRNLDNYLLNLNESNLLSVHIETRYNSLNDVNPDEELLDPKFHSNGSLLSIYYKNVIRYHVK